MAQRNELLREELLYGRIAINFANAKTHEEAINNLNDSIREIHEIPRNLKIRKSSAKSVQKDQNKIKELLEDLIKQDHLYNVSLIHDYILCYNFTCKPFLDVQEDGSISEIPLFHDQKSTDHDTFIAYCLVNFLKSDISIKRKHILKCNMCKDFFISKKIDERTKYCPICSYKNKMSKEERSKHDKKKRLEKKLEKKEKLTPEQEKQIERMMSTGHTREQALEYIKLDMNEDYSTDRSPSN